MTEQNDKPQTPILIQVKRHFCFKLVGFFTRIFFLIALLVLLIFGSLMLRLQRDDINLSKWTENIEVLLSDALPENITIEIEEPILKKDKESFLYPRLSLKKVFIKSEENSYNLSKVDINFSLTSLFLLKVRPSYVEVQKSNFLHKVLTSNEEPLTIREVYKKYFGRKGIFYKINEVKFHNISFKGDLTALEENFSPYVDLRDADIILKNDALMKRVNLTTFGSVHSDIASLKFQTNHDYNANTNKIKTNILMEDGKLNYQLSEDKDEKIISDFHANLKMNHNDIGKIFSVSPTFSMSKGNVPVKNNKDEVILIKDMLLTGEYLPIKSQLQLKIDDLQSSIGNINGSLSVVQTKDKKHDINLMLQGKKIDYNKFFEKPIEIKKLIINGKADEAFKKLNLNNISLQSQNLELSGSSEIEKLASADYKVNANIFLNGINKDSLLSLWPVKLPGSARSWIEANVIEAHSKKGNLKLSYNTKMDFPELDLNIPFYDSSFYYRSPMSPAEKVVTDFHLKNKKLSFDIHSGEINKVSIEKGSFEIPDITAPLPKGIANLTLKGNSVSLFEVLDQEPLKIFTPNNIDYKNKKGEFTGDISLSLPLSSTVTFDDVDLKGKVNVNDVDINLNGGEYRITDYNGNVDFTNKGLSSDFSAQVNNVSFKGNWQESFSSSSPYSTIVTGKGNISDVNLKDFGIDLSDYWQGASNSELTLKLKSGIVKELSVDADLQYTQLSIPYTTYRDEIGKHKKVKLFATQEGDDFIVKKVSLASKKTDFTIENIISRNGKLREFTVTSLQAENFAKDGYLHYYDDDTNKPKVEFKADKLILDHVFAYDPAMPSATAKAEEFTRVRANLDVKELAVYPDKILKNVALTVNSPNKTPFLMNIKGKIAESDEIIGQIENQDAVTKRITVTTNDAGALLKAYDSFHYYRKGQFTLNANMKKIAQGQPSIISGNVSIDDGRLIDAPVVARIFSLASLTGIVDRLSENGLSMDKIETDFIKNGSQLKLSHGVVSGSAVGFSFSGTYNTETADANLKGTLVPLYEINSFISNIPLIGDIFTSRKGEGIFGMGYTMKGKISEPDIQVNPLSALTPGILRRIFE